MSMFSNLFHKNSAATLGAQQSSLVSNPVITNATQMNNEFLAHHNKQYFNQQGSMLQQPILSQAPIAPVYQAPLASSFLSNTFQSSSLQRGSMYQRGGPYRQIRLRTHSWGNRSENGWSGFNNWKYLPQNLASWEPKNVVLEELRLQGRQNRGLNFQQSFVQPALLMAAAPIAAQPAPILFSGKQSRGHHHGLRKKRAQAVLPVQPIGGGPAIATIAPTPIVAAPLMSAPLLSAPIATRAAPLVAPLAAPAVETIVRPTIIQETVRTDRIVEVQPVLHREIEQPVVHHIEKHITEAPAASRGGVVRLAPIVEQQNHTRVINEITPIVHREVAVRQVERVEEHLSEHVVAPAQHTKSVQYESAPLVAPVAPVAVARELPLQQPTVLAPLNAPAIHQTLTKTPIVEEVVRTDRVVEIQPVVHREVEQSVINHIEKHITEAPAPMMGGTVRMAPIVQETHNTRVIEEIQPVVHRERAVATVERVEEHLVEHIVAPTQHTNSVVNESVIAQPALLNTSAPLVAPLTSSPALASAPLTNTIPITKVVPTAPINAYGAAMM